MGKIAKAIAAGVTSSLVAVIFAAVSDGQVTPEEVAAVFGTLFGVGGLTFAVPNAQASETSRPGSTLHTP